MGLLLAHQSEALLLFRRGGGLFFVREGAGQAIQEVIPELRCFPFPSALFAPEGGAFLLDFVGRELPRIREVRLLHETTLATGANETPCPELRQQSEDFHPIPNLLEGWGPIGLSSAQLPA
jgi:hypothetical protein